MKKFRCALLVSQILLLSLFAQSQQRTKLPEFKLDNPPITAEYLQQHLFKSGPHLILTPAIENKLKQGIKTDPVLKNYFAALKLNAYKILDTPLIERKMVGKRMLATSRELLYRLSVLSMVCRMEKDPVLLKRINDELMAACNFSDWHPSHALDVSELALAVAIPVDWLGDVLPKSTVELAKTSLIEKAMKTWFKEKKDPFWLNWTNNWNQVCTAGMIAAALVTAHKNPELSAKVIDKCLEGIPNALEEYAPDGVYPEGATYWTYGSTFSAITSSMLYSSFGTDFGLSSYAPFIKSADFRLLMVAPSGMYYNYFDSADGPGVAGEGDLSELILAWFAAKTNNASYFLKQKFLEPAASIDLSRVAGIGFIWLSQVDQGKQTELPLVWKGRGENPVVVFRGGKDDPHQYYFGGKGGNAGQSHGNMDAGSFVFELDGVRWSIDPGKEVYNDVEQTGFDLWSSCQQCERWKLLSKSNFGHSTLTVNDSLFKVSGKATLIDFKEGEKPEAVFEMTPVYRGNLASAQRHFIKDSDHSLTIEDDLVLNDSTKNITWQLMTTADVVPTKTVLY
ncbi:MAG: heparinase II/III domain-containing protein [Flavisolibacter sp.]